MKVTAIDIVKFDTNSYVIKDNSQSCVYNEERQPEITDYTSFPNFPFVFLESESKG